MTDPMTDARLAEIARVHASVDRFPFTSDRYGVRDVDGDMITDSYGLFWTEELAEFVALSSTAVPELLAEVRRLREENERLRAEAGKLEREREAYQRGEQDSRGNPMPCLHLDEADAVLAALREAYQRGEQDSRGNPTPCLHPDSIEERQNATDAAQEGGAK